ncbi:uncharacterized protein [Aristolochia californica]|uniref:uncharacterized protein n=1 Tax=Aristolochia californica TaxID=171875 RepID=UPI0035DB1535
MAGRNENVGQAMLLAFSHNRNAGETWVVREMVTIKTVKARQVFRNRGNPTVEVDIICSNGTFSRAAVYLNLSKVDRSSIGISEPLKLKDGGSDYLGKGVLNVVENVNAIIGHALIEKDPTEQTKIDNFRVQVLDGTVNEWDWCKPKLGATAILAVSLAICKTGASVKYLPLYQHSANLTGHKTLVLPVPAFNELNGGSPVGSELALQKFMILPVRASSFKEAMQMGVEVYHHLKAVIRNNYGHAVTSVHGSETNVGNAIINMYSKCRAIYASDRAFATMYRSDEVLWSTIIGAYEQNGLGFETFRRCREMAVAEFGPTQFFFASCISTCFGLAALDVGRQFHSLMIKAGFVGDVYVGSSVVDMYAKGLTQHGRADNAIQIFNELAKTKTDPNKTTFIYLFTACSHVGLLEESMFFFDMLCNNYKMEPESEPYCCLVDVLGRVGKL